MAIKIKKFYNDQDYLNVFRDEKFINIILPKTKQILLIEPERSSKYDRPRDYIWVVSNKNNIANNWWVGDDKIHAQVIVRSEQFSLDDYLRHRRLKIYKQLTPQEFIEWVGIKLENNLEVTTMENVTNTTMTAVVATNETAPTTPAPAPVGGQTINSVADFLAMVHSKKNVGLADGKIKVSLDEVKNRLDGKIQIMAVEKTANEGRNFYLVQISENSYMFSFKMMTTIISKWEDACGGVEKLNEMLAQANIVGVVTDAEYNGKKYSKFDIQ